MMKTLAVAITLALTTVSAHAADPHFWIGFTGVQSQTSYRYIDVQIGSNETDSTAQGWNLWMTLSVQKDGVTVCQTSVEKVARVRPAIRPMRFQVYYPPLDPRQPHAFRPPPVSYKLFAKVEVREPGTSRYVMTASNVYAFEFPPGGTPSCLLQN